MGVATDVGNLRDERKAAEASFEKWEGLNSGRTPAFPEEGGRAIQPMPAASGNSLANCGCAASMRASSAAIANSPATTENRVR